MQRTDDPTGDDAGPAPRAGATSRSSNSPISVALLVGVACVPLVVAVGFLTDRPAERAAASAPSDISVLALRGRLDAAAADGRPSLPTRAGY